MSESTKPCSTCTRVPYGILQVTTFTIICSLVTLSIFGFYMKEIWKKDWEKYRCNILALPFANYVNPKESVAKNFNYCLQKKTDPMIREFTKKKLHSSAAEAARGAQQTIEETIKTQKESENMKEDIGGIFGSIHILYERLVNILLYTSHSIQNVFLKINAVVWSIYYYLIAQINTIAITIARFQRMLSVINLLAILITIKFIAIWPISVIMFALIATEELDNLNQIMVKQLKNRYNDPTGANKKFVLGIDRAKMRLYDVEDTAQTLNIRDEPPKKTQFEGFNYE